MVRDNGRIVDASTSRLHCGHHLIFEGSFVMALPASYQPAVSIVTGGLLLVTMRLNPRQCLVLAQILW